MDLTAAKEFVGESEAEAVEKAAKFFGVAEAQPDLRGLLDLRVPFPRLRHPRVVP